MACGDTEETTIKTGSYCYVAPTLDERYTDELAEKYAVETGAAARPKETISEIDERGAFIRQPNAFIRPFGDKEGDLKADIDRYIVYWATGCNWSNRPLIAREILGLQDVIKDYRVDHTGESNKYGWGFRNEEDHKDPNTGVYFLSQLYHNANPDFKGRATTPTFADYKEKKAVNNDYHRLTNYIEVQFRPFQAPDAPDLYPKAYRKEIDQFNDWLFPHINNAHYRMAFCQSPEAHHEAFDDFYESLDKLEVRLSNNRFLFGDFITDSDIRAYVSLIRWDVSYYKNVGPTKHRIQDYPNIWGYVKELNSIPAFHKYSDPAVLAASHASNKQSLFADYNSRILAKENWAEVYKDDGSRAKLSNHPDEIYLRHPAGETYEEYASEISRTIWNSPSWEDRNPKNGVLDVDASINPLKGKIDK